MAGFELMEEIDFKCLEYNNTRMPIENVLSYNWATKVMPCFIDVWLRVHGWSAIRDMWITIILMVLWIPQSNLLVMPPLRQKK